ncbi:MAG TPA: helix-turn-helix domain-containing protein [Candidatus Eisenbacteria bacterium]|nr:helix-turn-helix domain-containing protein [Candidatus Eisenbacteria bacterium]
MAVRRAAPARPPGRSAVVERLRERADEIVAETVRRIAAEIPAYGGDQQRGLLADVGEHVRKHHAVLVPLLEAGRPPTREDLMFTRRHTAARVGRIPIADYMRAFRTYLEVMWRELLAQARDPASAQAVLTLVGLVLDYVNVATTYAAELYLEIEQVELAGGERVRRDLLEDLVAGRPVLPGPRQDAAREAGLGPAAPCLAIVAVPRSPAADEQSLRSAAGALARACGGPRMPLTVLRRDEIVQVAPSREPEAGEVVTRLRQAFQRLAQQRLPLAIGVSTVHQGLTDVASAYREARGAAESLGPEGGVLALPTLSALDYLTSFRDPTAQRLISPQVRRFVQDDLAHGGVLSGTLLAYVDCDLNVKAMSRRLYIHSNTAHHRLHRIAEQTGLDLRKLGDVLSLVVAVRLARPLGARPPGAWGA